MAAVEVFFGNGDGTFGTATRVPTGGEDVPISLAVSDANGDRIDDLHAGLYLTGDVVVMLGTAGRAFETGAGFSTGTRLHQLHTADFDNDGVSDIAAEGRCDLGGAVAVMVNQCGSVSTVCASDMTGEGVLDINDFSMFTAAYSSGSFAADFSADGRLDLTDLAKFVEGIENGCN